MKKLSSYEFSKKNSPKKFSIGKVIIRIFTVFLTITFLLLLSNGIQTIRQMDYRSDYYTEENYLTTLSDEEYTQLLDLTYHDSYADKKYTSSVLECKAVAHYYEAAVLYHSYQNLNDSRNAEKQAARMKYYASQVDTLKEHIQKINTLLNIKAPS